MSGGSAGPSVGHAPKASDLNEGRRGSAYTSCPPRPSGHPTSSPPAPPPQPNPRPEKDRPTQVKSQPSFPQSRIRTRVWKSPSAALASPPLAAGGKSGRVLGDGCAPGSIYLHTSVGGGQAERPLRPPANGLLKDALRQLLPPPSKPEK